MHEVLLSLESRNISLRIFLLMSDALYLATLRYHSAFLPFILGRTQPSMTTLNHTNEIVTDARELQVKVVCTQWRKSYVRQTCNRLIGSGDAVTRCKSEHNMELFMLRGDHGTHRKVGFCWDKNKIQRTCKQSCLTLDGSRSLRLSFTTPKYYSAAKYITRMSAMTFN